MARRTRSREDGAVMLVVMLILMVATAAAAVGVQSTQYELQAAGQERQALQTRYLAESAMMTTVAWFDKVFDPTTGGGFTRFYQDCTSATQPEMWRYGQPEVGNGTEPACRLDWVAMKRIKAVATGEVGPTNRPGGEDLLGSLGPRQANQPEVNPNASDAPDFVSDLVCREEVFLPGTVVAGGTTTSRTRRYYCTVISRARTLLPGAAAGTKKWTYPLTPPAGTTCPTTDGCSYKQEPTSTYHEMRMTLLTPSEIF